MGGVVGVGGGGGVGIAATEPPPASVDAEGFALEVAMLRNPKRTRPSAETT